MNDRSGAAEAGRPSAGLRHVAGVGSQELPLVRLDRRQQLPARLDRSAAGPCRSCPSCAISDSGSALANMNIGHVKSGPFSLRSFHAQSPIAPSRHAVGRPPADLTGTQVHLPALHHQLPLQRRELARLGHALLRLHARVVERREDRRDEEREQAAPLDFVDQVERRLARPRRSRPGCRR